MYRVNKLMVLLASVGQSVCAGASYHACTHACTHAILWPSRVATTSTYIASVSIKVLSSRGTLMVMFAALACHWAAVVWYCGDQLDGITV